MSSLTAFSQRVMADTISVKCFPVPVVKAIAKDLLRGDSAIVVLRLTEIQLKETENKVIVKDSIITYLQFKETNYLKIVDEERNRFGILADFNKDLKMQLRKEKVKNKFTKIGGAILILGALLIK